MWTRRHPIETLKRFLPNLRKKQVTVLALLLVTVYHPLAAQQKAIAQQLLNQGWQFSKSDTGPKAFKKTAAVWQPVNLPHTWNVDDVMDDTPGYYRGACWYRKELVLADAYQTKELYLFFEGANQQTAVYINGHKAGTHTGGYTAFTVPVSPFLQPFPKNGRVEILVRVDNSQNEDVPPLSADFTFYGGLYRNVWLLAKEKIHFQTNDRGSGGVAITTPMVQAAKASVSIRSLVANNTGHAAAVQVTSVIKDRTGNVVAQQQSIQTVQPKKEAAFLQENISVAQPRLWSPDNPYLYEVVTTISDAATRRVLDESRNPLGFRWFRFDADSGFFLNGKPCKLIGTSRHQDYKGLGNAVPDSLARRDLLLLKEMGANFLRVAHYPQAPCVLRICDSIGLLASVEIPVVNEITESEAFYRNCEIMQTEMIRQNFNHPSVVLWCYMNEVLLKPHFTGDKVRQKNYIANVEKLAKRLDSLTRREDPFRPTMMAHHGDMNKYADAGLIAIPSVVGWNLYSGWYGGEMNGFQKFLDNFHQRFPQKPVMVTEYGADADPRIHSLAPVRFDKSVEYTTLFHRYYLAQIRKKAFVAGGVVWNLADFNSETRTESMPHINNKGLLEWDRTPKDPYWFYLAALQTSPVTRILASQQLRTGTCDSNRVCVQPLMVASNAHTVELFLNGVSVGKRIVADNLCQFEVPFISGQNHLKAIGSAGAKKSADTAVILFRMGEEKLVNAAFQPLNILMCPSRFFTDDAQVLWQPNQAYRNGSWGSVGGRSFQLQTNSRLPFGTDRNILQTGNDPVYQTQWVGIRQYRLDVPPGLYQLTLHFAELLGGPVPALPYNLTAAGRKEEEVQRIFDVVVNKQTVLKNFNIAAAYGVAVPVKKKITVAVSKGEGIVIDFRAIAGEPVLNALQLIKEK